MKPKNSVLLPKRNLPCRRAVAIVVVILAGLGWSASSATGESRPCVKVRPQDDVWLISTRHLGACPDIKSLGLSSLNFCRFDGCSQKWTPSTAADFWQSHDPSMLVTVYVHGNRIKASLACERGLHLYRNLCVSACEHRRIRHVIWSWPSDIMPGPVRDARVKAMRTPPQSHLMAQWLSQFPCRTQVRMTGLSYGARAICGSLHLLGGGSLCGTKLSGCYRGNVPCIRAILWAPAIPTDWLLQGNLNGQALCAAEQIYVFYNRHDPVLIFYKHLIADGRRQAIGYTGLRWRRRLGPCAERYHQINVTRQVGYRHSWAAYAESPVLMRKTRALMLQ